MDKEPIRIATREEAMEIGKRLRAFNVSVVGEHRFEPLWLVHPGADGEIIGGVVGEVGFDWLHLNILWVAEAHRKTCLGSALLAAAERAAIDIGARHAWLDSFEWQAEGFYLKHGYSVFGRLEDFPEGQQRMFMRKTLVNI